MTPAELSAFEAVNPHITTIDHEHLDAIGFRNERLPWYRNNRAGQTVITCGKLAEMTADGLLQAINKGLEVEQICRITGYFSKVGQWNKGKQGELKDRAKWTIGQPVLQRAAVG
jgi:anaerobic ribonucleoside-triphosphate reductase